jgi:long-subunit fatty acid transport protein
MKIKFFILLFFSSLVINAQYYDPDKAKELAKDSVAKPKQTLEPAYDVWKHIYAGANFALRFGTIQYIEFSPVIGYMIHEKFSAGFIFTCIYYKDNRLSGIPGFGIFGVSPFLKFMITETYFVVAELNNINYPYFYSRNGTEYRKWETNPMLGIGSQFDIGRKFAFTSAIMYNFNQRSNLGPFAIRAGFIFRFND